MFELLPTLFFYLFATLTVGSGVMVISAKNPVHSVLFLILAFFNAAALFVLIGAEYIAMTLVIVYVGAVAVLFLFVVMMLDIRFEELRQGFLRTLPLGIAVAVAIFLELVLVFSSALERPVALVAASSTVKEGAKNTEALGNVLYTYYLYPFQLSGIILLVAMISAIVLTLRTRHGVRRQNVRRQLFRTRAESMEVVQVNTGEGIP